MNKKYYLSGLSVFIVCTMLIFSSVVSSSFAQQQQKKGVEDMMITNQDKTLTIYPVPVTSTVHIYISPGLKPYISKIEIYNLIGRKVMEQSIIDPNTTDVSFSNISQLPAGIYMVIGRDKYGRIIKSAKMVIDK